MISMPNDELMELPSSPDMLTKRKRVPKALLLEYLMRQCCSHASLSLPPPEPPDRSFQQIKMDFQVMLDHSMSPPPPFTNVVNFKSHCHAKTVSSRHMFVKMPNRSDIATCLLYDLSGAPFVGSSSAKRTVILPLNFVSLFDPGGTLSVSTLPTPKPSDSVVIATFLLETPILKLTPNRPEEKPPYGDFHTEDVPGIKDSTQISISKIVPSQFNVTVRFYSINCVKFLCFVEFKNNIEVAKHILCQNLLPLKLKEHTLAFMCLQLKTENWHQNQFNEHGIKDLMVQDVKEDSNMAIQFLMESLSYAYVSKHFVVVVMHFIYEIFDLLRWICGSDCVYGIVIFNKKGTTLGFSIPSHQLLLQWVVFVVSEQTWRNTSKMPPLHCAFGPCSKPQVPTKSALGLVFQSSCNMYACSSCGIYPNSNVHCYASDRHFYCYIIEFLLVFSSAHEETKLKGSIKGKVDNSVQLRSDAYMNIVPLETIGPAVTNLISREHSAKIWFANEALIIIHQLPHVFQRLVINLPFNVDVVIVDFIYVCISNGMGRVSYEALRLLFLNDDRNATVDDKSHELFLDMQKRDMVTYFVMTHGCEMHGNRIGLAQFVVHMAWNAKLSLVQVQVFASAGHTKTWDPGGGDYFFHTQGFLQFKQWDPGGNF
jgi:hypothetical protein